MIALALDCSTARGSVASADADSVRWQGEFAAGRGQGGALFSALENAMRALAGAPLEFIVVGLGPGSYSGTRQVIAAATGLSLATGARLFGVASSVALETDAPAYHALGDARRGGFYYTAVADGICLAGPELLDAAGIRARLAARPDWPIFADGPLPGLEDLAAALVLPLAARLLTALAAARILPPLEPIYLRPVSVTLPPSAASMNPPPPARCWAEIDCGALRHNAAAARALAGPDATILAIVKADGYGHGMTAVARELHAGGAGVRDFGVANVAEAARLQDALPDCGITLLSPALPDERAEIVARGLLPWISSSEEAAAYAHEAAAARGPGGEPFDVEIKVDTGMGRIGVLEDGLPALLAALARLPALRLAGILTHLPAADEDAAYTEDQLARFAQLLPTPPADRRHAQNSAGLSAFARRGCNVVRPGLMLYGASPLPEYQSRLRPVLTLKTRITLVRTLPAGRGVSYGRTFITSNPMRVGTLAAGYGDGYPRHLSNTGASVLVRGRRCPLLGRVTMDQVMIDLDALPADVAAGEEAVLLGAQGAEEIPAAELAARSGTIPWEIFTGLTSRVARRYLHPAA